ncbi:sensor histidine kinase [Paenibacillus cremeus]|uniref:histidine kinase n=1 Tax=Paenibacillus cremeus TaxID=2163881 RepID=A0A559KFK3_9BACL|nr:sensor histidine kinase [Paenibacillus cremeus]TVY10905.1 sensor histidine kinase [Paenibacillus cremeus]
MVALKESQWSGRSLGLGAIVFFLMHVNQMFTGPMPKIVFNLAVWASYLVVLMLPKAWWTRRRLLLAALFIVGEAAAGMLWLHEMKLLYFTAMLLFATSVQLISSKSYFPAMAAMLVTVLLFIRYGRDDLFSVLSFVLLSIVLFLGIRSRRQRMEMYELNKRHLVELQEAYDQLQEASVTAMQNAVLEERTRIARDIHDAVGHSLTSIIVQTQALRYMVRKDPVQAEQSIESMLTVARQGLADIRNSVHSLADDHSASGIIPLKALLSRMEASSSIRYTFHTEVSDEEMDAEVSGLWFRLLQEAITNIIRHSQATFVEVQLTKGLSSLVIRVADNGCLVPSGHIREGFGLKVMRERVEERGGQLHYKIREPHGFEIVAELPAAPAIEQEEGDDDAYDDRRVD